MECRGVNKDIIEGLRIKNLDLNMPSRKIWKIEMKV